MRNFSNQNSGSGSGRPTSGGNRPSGGNRGGYQGRSGSGGYNRDNRDSREHRGPRDNRDNRGGGGYRGNSNRYESRPGQHRSGPPSSGNYRNDRGDRPRYEDRPRHDRGEGNFQPRTGGSWVEVTGRSAEDAIEEASRRFNVNKNDLKTEVLDEGSKGFLGLGSKPAKVKISLKSSAVPPFAEGVLSRLLRGMSLPDKVAVRRDEDGNTVLNIQGPSSGTLIGRHGHTLEALQYLVGKVVQRMTGDEKSIIIVDVENYLERQKDKLKELAVNLAGKAKETGVEIPMRPMSSKDRRVVHLTLKEHEHVTTESRGEGLRRKVVIVPKVKAEVVTPEAAAAAEAAGNVEVGNAAPPADAQAPVESQPVVEKQPVVENQPPAPMAKVEEPVHTDKPEPGNTVPKEPEIDDNVGNRV